MARAGGEERKRKIMKQMVLKGFFCVCGFLLGFCLFVFFHFLDVTVLGILDLDLRTFSFVLLLAQCWRPEDPPSPY